MALSEILLILIRYGLFAVATRLIDKHVLTPEQGTVLVDEVMKHAAYVLGALGIVVWALLSKYWAGLKLKLALDMPAGTTKEELKEAMNVKSTTTKLLSLIAVIALSMGVTACGPKTVRTNVSPVADVANAGGKIQESAHVILVTAKSAHDQKLISDGALGITAIAVNKIGELGLDLKLSLDAYNVAKKAGSDTAKQKEAVNAVLTAMTATLADVGKAIPSGVLRRIDEAASTILQLIALTKGGLL